MCVKPTTAFQNWMGNVFSDSFKAKTLSVQIANCPHSRWLKYTRFLGHVFLHRKLKHIFQSKDLNHLGSIYSTLNFQFNCYFQWVFADDFDLVHFVGWAVETGITQYRLINSIEWKHIFVIWSKPMLMTFVPSIHIVYIACARPKWCKPWISI